MPVSIRYRSAIIGRRPAGRSSAVWTASVTVSSQNLFPQPKLAFSFLSICWQIYSLQNFCEYLAFPSKYLIAVSENLNKKRWMQTQLMLTLNSAVQETTGSRLSCILIKGCRSQRCCSELRFLFVLSCNLFVFTHLCRLNPVRFTVQLSNIWQYWLLLFS